MSETGLLGRLDASADWIRGKRDGAPRVGLVLGSGLGSFAGKLKNRVAIPYQEIPHFPVPSGVVGHAGELVLGDVERTSVAVLSGRVHFYEGRPMPEVVFPVRFLARLGVSAVVLTNAAGGIRRTFKPGDLMLIADHINAFGTNPLLGPNEDSLGPRFPDMSAVYDAALRKLAREKARKLGVPLREGVYLGTAGPSYETPAEIRAYRVIGADAVGMSTVPEALVLRHAGIRVLGISTITNMAAGMLPQPLDHAEVLATTKRVGERFVRLLTALVPDIARSGRA